jgi:putative ABC transport system ATP-binding protein
MEVTEAAGMDKNADDIVIRLDNVCKEYEIGDIKVNALKNAEFTIKRGDFVSIVGPSGSGKSTMMNIIGCLDRSFSGEYLLSGKSVDRYSEEELAMLRNSEIGFVFQDFDLIGNLTAYENVELPLIYKGVPKARRRELVDKALERVGLAERCGHKPSELSGGQQQRAAIARAMVTEPSIILADEPTGNLDSRTGDDIMEIFHELHDNGNTIVLITHDNDVARQAERIFRIRDGKVSEIEDGIWPEACQRIADDGTGPELPGKEDSASLKRNLQ